MVLINDFRVSEDLSHFISQDLVKNTSLERGLPELESKFLLEFLYYGHERVEYVLLLIFRRFDPLAPDSLLGPFGA